MDNLKRKLIILGSGPAGYTAAVYAAGQDLIHASSQEWNKAVNLQQQLMLRIGLATVKAYKGLN